MLYNKVVIKPKNVCKNNTARRIGAFYMYINMYKIKNAKFRKTY